MLRYSLITFLFSLMTVNIASAQFERKQDGAIIIDDFQNDEVGHLPKGWYNRNGKRQPINYEEGPKKAAYKYTIKKNGPNKFLRYAGQSARHMNFPLANKDGVNIDKTPILSWKWRVFQVPKGANEDNSDLNDTAASIYVVFDVNWLKIPEVIRYTWSTTLPVGTELSKNMGKQKIIVVASGTEKAGRWLTFERNIVEDYKRLFGSEPPEKPLAILILSDADSTGDNSVADYDDIILKPAQH